MRLIEGQTLAAVISECCDSSQLSISNDVESIGKAAQQEIQSGDKSPHSKDTIAAALSTLRSDRPKDFFRRVAELGIQAAEALDHAHQMGIVHRDIKPSNLMVESVVSGQLSVVSDQQRTRDNGQRTTPKLYITDFGLARIESDAAAGLTMTGDLLGTLRYMSPNKPKAVRPSSTIAPIFTPSASPSTSSLPSAPPSPPPTARRCSARSQLTTALATKAQSRHPRGPRNHPPQINRKDPANATLPPRRSPKNCDDFSSANPFWPGLPISFRDCANGRAVTAPLSQQPLRRCFSVSS